MKDYKNWHKLKTEIENNSQEKKFHEREIWWCSLGENIGYEEDGKHKNFERPILVLRKFNSEMFFGLPLTSKNKNDLFHSTFILKFINENGLLEEKESFAILSQLRLLSSKRMIRRVVIINEKTFDKIKNDFIKLMFIKNKTDPFRGPQVPNGNL